MEYMVSIPPRGLIAKGEKIIFVSGNSEMKMSYEEISQFPHLLNFVLKCVGDKPVYARTKF
jgi:hypothetical protein